MSQASGIVYRSGSKEGLANEKSPAEGGLK